MTNGREKSDPAIVAGKPTNKAERSAEGNAGQQSTRRAQNRESVSLALERLRRVSPSDTQGGSGMPESSPYGSVRWALSNERSYRDYEESAAVRPLKISNPPQTAASLITSIGYAARWLKPPHPAAAPPHAATAISAQRTIFFRISDFRPYGATAISDAANSASIALLNCFAP